MPQKPLFFTGLVLLLALAVGLGVRTIPRASPGDLAPGPGSPGPPSGPIGVTLSGEREISDRKLPPVYGGVGGGFPRRGPGKSPPPPVHRGEQPPWPLR